MKHLLAGFAMPAAVAGGGKTYQVGVDAKTVPVLENAAEGRDPD